MKDSIYFILYLASILGIIKFIIWYGKNQAKRAAQELEYLIMYLNIQTILADWDINKKNYCAITQFLEQLDHLPHKNEEKTTVLEEAFLKKYKDIRYEFWSERRVLS